MKMIEGEKVEQAFSGVSLTELINAIEEKTSVKKGEFESTIEFDTRRAASLSRKLFDDYGIDDTFAAVRTVASRGKTPSALSYTFNPDTNDVSLFVLPTSSRLNGIGAPEYQTSKREGRGLDILEFDTNIESKGTYQGSNAYGATVTVDKTIMMSSGIAAKQIPFLNFKRETFYPNPSPAFQFKMDNSKAAKELPALKALIVFKIMEPYVYYDFVRKEPTRDSPSDIYMQGKLISGTITGIIYYSGVTGEVLARLPETFGKPQTSSLVESVPSTTLSTKH
jgi:hypothetical protein